MNVLRRWRGIAISDGATARCSHNSLTCTPAARSSARDESRRSRASSAAVCIVRSEGSCRSSSDDCWCEKENLPRGVWR